MILMIKTWRNGATGGEVKDIINYNFTLVSRYLTKDIKALSTQERNLLSSEYLNENTLVFDTTENKWYKYSKGTWVKTSVDDSVYTQDISIGDWENNSIQIPFNQHGIENPIVQLLIQNGNSFTDVFGGVAIDADYNINLSADIPFDGKVVVK